MKIMFLSDIHGITTNLNYIKKKYNELKIDQLVVLGDLYYIGPGNQMIEGYNIKEVMNFLKSFNNIICIRGNCDSDVDLKASDFPVNEGLSSIYVDDINIYLSHGHIYNEKENKKFNDVEGVLIFGHYHYPLIDIKDKMVYINVGSISLPRNGYNSTYVIYENKTFTIYDVKDNIINSIKV